MPIYSKTASNGHFGREDQGFTWEIPVSLQNTAKINT